MVQLTRLLEIYGAGQYYDIGRDFSNFRRTLDGADDKVVQNYEKTIGDQLIGKRIRAKASRGYKQYVKDYEFDVAGISIDDYYGNYVIVAHDNSTPKPKEYFLKSGFKVQIIGPATGQPSPQKGGNPDMFRKEEPVQPKENPDKAQSAPMVLAPAGNTPSERPVKEEKGLYDAYSIEDIARDIKSWLPSILVKPETALRDFIKGLGWSKEIVPGTNVSMFDLKLPAEMIKPNTSADKVKQMILQSGQNGTGTTVKYDLIKMEPNQEKGDWLIRIKKTTTKTKPQGV